jgi:hypothetical protein
MGVPLGLRVAWEAAKIDAVRGNLNPDSRNKIF